MSSQREAAVPGIFPVSPSHAAGSVAGAGKSTIAAANRALQIGIAGLVVTGLGLVVSPAHAVAMSYLVGITYITAIAIGMLMLVFIHHIFDAYWSVFIRRQWEHGLAAFKWLFVLFLPLVIVSWVGTKDIIWPWMNPAHVVHGGTVATDVLYQKKSGLLNMNVFTVSTVVFFLLWIFLSARLRKASFSQDSDGDPKWTRMNRVSAAMGLPIGALSLTGAAIFWMMSLEYHWFSTMYGVWFFANCMRGALCCSVLIMIWLYRRGDYVGILNRNHLHSVGQVMMAFTVFWAYVTFSQYFLIWNANIPEETFWFNMREVNLDGSPNQWKWIGIFGILFGHFVVPFCTLLSYRFKVTHHIIRRIAIWILCTMLLDFCYNIMPSLKDPEGNPENLLSINLVWILSSVIGVGGVAIWAYLRSFNSTKLIPIRDPRIGECLTSHE